jgi:biopolymer transport protein ExbB/TolQ
MKPLSDLFLRGGLVMFGIAAVSLAAWFLSLRTWFLAGFILKKIQNINNGNHDFDRFAITTQTARLSGNLFIVGTLAMTLPLLGLFGTVLGMLLSFEVIQLYSTSQPHLLVSGISQALITTQAGLWTAVPVFFFHHIIRSRMRLIRNETEVLFHVIHTNQTSKKNNDNPAFDIRPENSSGDY